MKPPYQKFYAITLIQPETGIIEQTHVVLHRKAYKKLKSQLNEIVYTDEKGEWALKSIVLNE